MGPVHLFTLAKSPDRFYILSEAGLVSIERFAYQPMIGDIVDRKVHFFNNLAEDKIVFCASRIQKS